jgi:O-antigen ligase
LEFLPGDFYFDRAHNKPMEVLATTGIFGFLSYLSIFGIALYFLNRLRKKKEWFLPSLALMGGLTGYFIQNIFIFDFHESYLMFFLSLAFISSYWLARNDRETIFF